MSNSIFEIDSFVFESRESYDRAKKEHDQIQELLQHKEGNQENELLKLYNKCVSEKRFSTVIGYSFLAQLRLELIQLGLGSDSSLSEIPIKEIISEGNDIMPVRSLEEGKYKRLYEQQKVKSVKYKIAVGALLLLMVGMLGITLHSQYSVFTYFTNYKANMEQELVDKYETWQADLQAREDKLK